MLTYEIGRRVLAFLEITRPIQVPIPDELETVVEINLEPHTCWKVSAHACDSLKAHALSGSILIRAGEENFSLTPGSKIEVSAPRGLFVYEANGEAASVKIARSRGAPIKFFLAPP